MAFPHLLLAAIDVPLAALAPYFSSFVAPTSKMLVSMPEPLCFGRCGAFVTVAGWSGDDSGVDDSCDGERVRLRACARTII
jgi:hypothetical protein